MRRFSLLLIATLAFAQNETVFRSTTQLVRVDVAAEDKNGKPVTDLRQDDFELIVNGRKQAIDTFTATTPVAERPVPLPRGTYSNKSEVSEVAHGRYLVFLLDWRNTNWSLQPFANQQLLKMLNETPPGGKVALYLINNGFQIVQEFTSDLDLIREKAAALEGAIPPPLRTLGQAEAAAKETVTAFQGIAKHLAGIAGQKMLIWVSTGFPDNEPEDIPEPGTPPVGVLTVRKAPSTAFMQEIDNAVRVLGDANIVVESTESKYLFASASVDTGPINVYENTLRLIAERTGGRYFPGDNNNLAGTFQTAVNDRLSSYEIGFYSGESYRPGLVPIEIRSKREGVTLRHREGFYIEKDPPAKPANVREEAADVLARAVDAVAVPMTAVATRTAGNMGTIRLNINVDAHSLTLKQEGDFWKGKASVLVRFATDVEDQVGDIPLDNPPFNLTVAQHERAMRDGINLRFTMKKQPDAVSMRVLVRDDDSGATGTVTIPVGDLPEAYGGR